MTCELCGSEINVILVDLNFSDIDISLTKNGEIPGLFSEHVIATCKPCRNNMKDFKPFTGITIGDFVPTLVASGSKEK